MVKSVQSLLPAAIGVIPLPYTSMAGIAIAALFGFIVWPIFAMVSLSRKDFAAAMESFIRIIPPPVGDMIANTFLEGNRAVAKIDEKRIRLGNDVANGLNQLSTITNSVSSSMKEGFETLAKQTQEAASNAKNAIPTVPKLPPLPTASTESQQVTLPTVTKGGFHRRTQRKAWRTKTLTRRKLEKL